MTPLDLLLTGLLAVAAFAGFRRGALLQLLTYGGLAVGLLLGALLAPRTAALVESPAAQAAVAAATFLSLGGLGDVAGWILGAPLRAAARRSRFRPADAAAGTVISVGALLLVTWFVALNLVNGPFPTLAREIRRSAVVRALAASLPEPPPVMAGVRRFLDRFGFPEVFAGLPPAPASPVEAPTQREAQAAFDAADQSTVQILGEACGRIQEGSGFFTAPDYVVTNAHVVAGMNAPHVRDAQGRTRVAVAVLFDPRLDVAVLHVPRGLGSPLPLAAGQLGRGAEGAVLGYPGGGALTGSAAAVRSSLDAVGRDIYGRGRVTRDVYELQAVVRPGSSGGPFVLVDGTVAGVVFAASSADPDVGYAIASAELIPLVREADGRTAPASTEPCAR